MKVFVTGVGGQLGHDEMNWQSVAMKVLVLILLRNTAERRRVVP